MQNAIVKRTLGYRRVSTYEQGSAGTSLEGQREEILRYCQYSRYPTPLDFVEIESGSAEKQERRTEVARLMASVRPGDLVIVTKLDRWSRDTLYTLASVRDIIKRGANFFSLAERFDARTPEGETQMALWASIAQMERARIKDRTEGRRKALRAAGKFVEGMPAFGYKRAQASAGSEKPRRLEIDPRHAAMVREMFDLCIRGYSAREISRHMRARYTACRFGHAWIGRALKNRVYAGQLALTPVRPHHHYSSSQLPAQWVDAHEPIVSMETFNRAQSALRGRRFGGAKPGVACRSATWLLRGIMRCGICGAACASHANSKGGRHEHAGYYVCRQRITLPESGRRCHGPFVRQAEMDSAVERLTIAHLDKIRGALTLPPPKRKVPDFGPRRADIAARRKRLVAAVAAGKLQLDDIDAPIAALDAELAELEAEAAAAEAECTSDTVESRRSALAFIDGIAEAWAGLTPGERRSVIMTLAERITIEANGMPAVIWRDASGLAVAVGSADTVPASRRATHEPVATSQRVRRRARNRGAARAVKQRARVQ